ncbi:MAG: hypothetical protein A4E73_03407 [Syntrophaceae bacterium PtaU1.Bin231]|nr:MAG: hypothetical protein A4E73_03407 [Syntrophaceae bacterium PtaU1.Bin231]
MVPLLQQGPQGGVEILELPRPELQLALAKPEGFLGLRALFDVEAQRLVDPRKLRRSLPDALLQFAVGLPEFLLHPFALGDVLDEPLIVQNLALPVADGADVVEDPARAAVPAADRDLEAAVPLLLDDPHAFPAHLGVGVELPSDVVDVCLELLGRSVAEDPGEGGVDVHIPPLGDAAVDPLDGILEDVPVFRFGQGQCVHGLLALRDVSRDRPVAPEAPVLAEERRPGGFHDDRGPVLVNQGVLQVIEGFAPGGLLPEDPFHPLRFGRLHEVEGPLADHLVGPVPGEVEDLRAGVRAAARRVGLGDVLVDGLDEVPVLLFAAAQRLLGPLQMRDVSAGRAVAGEPPVRIEEGGGVGFQRHGGAVRADDDIPEAPDRLPFLCLLLEETLHARRLFRLHEVEGRLPDHLRSFVPCNGEDSRACVEDDPLGRHLRDEIVCRFHQGAVTFFAGLQCRLDPLALREVGEEGHRKGLVAKGDPHELVLVGDCFPFLALVDVQVQLPAVIGCDPVEP